MSTAIKIESVSKLYRLGTVGTGTMAHDLNRWWHQIRGKEDPYAKVGQVNDRTKRASSEENRGVSNDSASPSSHSSLATSDSYVWALRDINLEVQQGEILGIIGRNGAGKSTLLKLLSRVTAPSTGTIRTKGRIASLLEVGTGFHSDLTGRENIYVNGALLGMRRHEITRHLDAIVDFSGCAKYLDTPVKRYSSGMTVRLGFAVAANLQCEIMVIDEVLAVGDAEFQKACVGRMKDVSREQGRTILFVSHNMSTVASLCQKGVLMSQGHIGEVGDVKRIVGDYVSANSSAEDGRIVWHPGDAPGDHRVRIRSVELRSEGVATADVRLDRPFEIEMTYEVLSAGMNVGVSFHVNDRMGACVFATGNQSSAMLNPEDASAGPLEIGVHKAICHVPSTFLNADTYFISAFIVIDSTSIVAESVNCVSFMTHDTGEMRKEYLGVWIGAVRPKFRWDSKLLQGVK
jgi:lipopolysaccharide transport system ATP-binding protein